MGFKDKFHNKYQTGGLQHLHAQHIRAEVGEECFYKYFKFAFVRNPFDKAVSQFAYMRTRPDLRSFLGMDKDDSFSRYLELISHRTHVQWEPQSAFLFDDNGDCLVDYIGRFEQFATDSEFVLNHLRIDTQVPHLNRREHRSYLTYYNDEDRAIVENLYERDLATFRYTFGP